MTAHTQWRAARLPEHPWLVAAEARIRRRPAAVHEEFPAAGRMVGRTPLYPGTDPQGLLHGCVDDLARARLMAALVEAAPAPTLDQEVAQLYHHGDDAERRAVLRAAPILPTTSVGTALALVTDALRTNDHRLVAAAMGPFASRHLDQHQWRHGVLKCLFLGVPLAAVAGLRHRADTELTRMAADLAAERRAAGREIGPDLRALTDMAVQSATTGSGLPG